VFSLRQIVQRTGGSLIIHQRRDWTYLKNKSLRRICKTIVDARPYFDNFRNMKIFNDSTLEVAASTFAALGSEQRLHVLRTLVRAGPNGLPIGILGDRCGVTGSTLTHHVKILNHAGLVTQTKQGRSIICAAVAYDQIETLSQFLMTECCADCDPTCEHECHD
jgi:DNA-binding transcriptional ArsR family regulator